MFFLFIYISQDATCEIGSSHGKETLKLVYLHGMRAKYLKHALICMYLEDATG